VRPMPERDIPRKIPRTMEKINAYLGEPVYTYALANAKQAIREKNPYLRISRWLSSLAQLAYAVQLHQARESNLKWILDNLPDAPVELTIRPGTLPENIIDDIVRKVESWVDVYLDSMVSEIKENLTVYVKYYVDTIPARVLAVMSRRKNDIERAVEIMKKVINELKEKAGTKEVSYHIELTYHDGVPPELLNRGYKEVKVLTGIHRGTDFVAFKEIMKKHGFIIKETRLAEMTHVMASLKVGDVDVWIDVDSSGFGFIGVTFIDILPEIPSTGEPAEIENIVVRPLNFKKSTEPPKKSVLIRKVQKFGNKTGIYLTRPFELIGVREGDEVIVETDITNQVIVIRPLRK
jgi:hypothetical protein